MGPGPGAEEGREGRAGRRKGAEAYAGPFPGARSLRSSSHLSERPSGSALGRQCTTQSVSTRPALCPAASLVMSPVHPGPTHLISKASTATPRPPRGTSNEKTRLLWPLGPRVAQFWLPWWPEEGQGHGEVITTGERAGAGVEEAMVVGLEVLLLRLLGDGTLMDLNLGMVMCLGLEIR